MTELQLKGMLVSFRNNDDHFGDWPEYRLRTLPTGPYLSQLVRLNLTCNGFDVVPPAVAAATALQHLDLGEQVLLNTSSAKAKDMPFAWEAGPVQGLHVLNSLTRLQSVTFRNDLDAQSEAAMCCYQAANPTIRVVHEPEDLSWLQLSP